MELDAELKAIIDIKLDMILLFPEDKELLIDEIKELVDEWGKTHEYCEVCGEKVEVDSGYSGITTCDDEECVYKMQRANTM
ncbi:hypothetical protein [Brevibacillus sp. MER 51]|uniref:hypothetical protein n=1 Tax=Brevibacillus sp. MER 51 TaxID=2939560 RepID=UPI00204182D2|nr:hypothetical protein [Brevibacillus sp. MER 51]MCM3141690.1 hypothetical protein [Brevibacillus sp. MER 51]